jgi:type IV secretory pathway VirJ component
MSPSHPSRARRHRLSVLIVAAAVLIGLGGLFLAGGYAVRDPIRIYPAEGQRRPVAALLMSGDMGLHFGAGPVVAKMLAAHGTEVVAVRSPVLFRFHRSRAEVEAIVAGLVRQALALTGANRIVLIGQSYGADMLQTGLVALPTDLRAHVAGVILIVPGATVYFRADPTNLLYETKPDGFAADTLPRLDWTPLTCIYGREESDSACRLLRQRNASIVALPGGHYVDHHQAALDDAVRRAVEAAR